MNAAEYWQPLAGVDILKLRASLLSRARKYFSDQDVLEVDTPALSTAATSDPQIDSVSAHLALRPDAEFFLHTSPEFCMKRMLCAGFPDIFQICKVFRDNEVGRSHQPEFTMIEWYRLNFGLDDIMNDTIELISAMLGDQLSTAIVHRITYQDAFNQHAGVDPRHCSLEELHMLCEADNDLISSLGDDRDSWLDLVLDLKVVPGFPDDRLSLLSHYPASQAALARLNRNDPTVAERFEVFFGRIELANGYVELSDSSELTQRIDNDNSRRRTVKLRTRPVDNRLIAAIESGLPACAGVALGFDRLLMIAAGKKDIRHVQSFPFPEQ